MLSRRWDCSLHTDIGRRLSTSHSLSQSTTIWWHHSLYVFLHDEVSCRSSSTSASFCCRRPAPSSPGCIAAKLLPSTVLLVWEWIAVDGAIDDPRLPTSRCEPWLVFSRRPTTKVRTSRYQCFVKIVPRVFRTIALTRSSLDKVSTIQMLHPCSKFHAQAHHRYMHAILLFPSTFSISHSVASIRPAHVSNNVSRVFSLFSPLITKHCEAFSPALAVYHVSLIPNYLSSQYFYERRYQT